MKHCKVTTILAILFVLLTSSVVLGCASPGPSATPTPALAATPTPEPKVLTVNGSVSTPLSLSMADLKAIGVSHINYTLNAHGTISYVDCDAISLNALLNKAGLLNGASNITFIGADAYNVTLPLTNITSDSRTVIAFTQAQGLRNCMPNEAAKYWVQNLTIIKVT